MQSCWLGRIKLKGPHLHMHYWLSSLMLSFNWIFRFLEYFKALRYKEKSLDNALNLYCMFKALNACEMMHFASSCMQVWLILAAFGYSRLKYDATAGWSCQLLCQDSTCFYINWLYAQGGNKTTPTVYLINAFNWHFSQQRHNHYTAFPLKRQ